MPGNHNNGYHHTAKNLESINRNIKLLIRLLIAAMILTPITIIALDFWLPPRIWRYENKRPPQTYNQQDLQRQQLYIP